MVLDHFTRHAQVYASQNKSGRTVVKKLFNDLILQFDIPDRILHDQRGEFENKLFQEFNYYKMWKERMNEAYRIINQSTTGRGHQDKTKKNIKSTLQPSEVGDGILVRNFTLREGSGKLISFWEQKVCIIKEFKNLDHLLYTVR